MIIGENVRETHTLAGLEESRHPRGLPMGATWQGILGDP